MSRSERKLADVVGKFIQPIRKGREMNNSTWIQGRIIISTKRVVLASDKGSKKIPIKKVENVGGRYDVNQQIAGVPNYVSISYDDNVILVSAEDTEQIEDALYGAVLDHKYVPVKSPAVRGGVVQDTDWEQGKIKTNEEELALALQNGSLVAVELDDVSSFDTGSRKVQGEKLPVLEVEHTSEDGTTLETHIAAEKRIAEVLGSFVTKEFEEKTKSSLDLDQKEKRVLVALYSGVSPFDIPDFLEEEPDTIEEIYDHLIEAGVLEEIRIRKEVDLTTRGRNIASEAMNE